MRIDTSILLYVVLCISLTYAWPCDQKDSSVTELKNFNHTYDFPCMYSGFVETDAKTESDIFYWFFLSPKPDYSTKLMLWFTGGPGDAGGESIFDENGPLRFRPHADGSYDVISNIKDSFVDLANVIYVDQPLGVGYSNSQVNVTEGQQVGETMVQFLLKFYELYPEQKWQDLIVAGNSYGGHYVPETAKAILEYNAKTTDKNMKIPLDIIIAEGGYVDPITQRLSIKDLAVGSGLATLDILKEYEILEQKCEQAAYQSLDTAFTDCKSFISLMEDTNGVWDIFDIRYHQWDYLNTDETYDDFFKSEEVQQQLHVSPGKGKTVPWTWVNETVYHNIRFDGMVDYTSYYDEILLAGIKTLVTTASFDGLDGVLGTQRWVENLNFTKNSISSYTYKNIYYYEDTDGKTKVGGSYKTWVDKENNQLSYATVYNAGHQIGNSQITISKSMLDDMMTRGKVWCHNQDNGGCSAEQKICYHMNNCNSNGFCLDQRCACNEKAFGPDCSILPLNLTSGSLELFPRQWTYFRIPQLTDDSIVSFSAAGENEVYVYHKIGNAPSRSDHDGFKKGNKMKYIIEAENKFTIVAVHNPSKTLNVTVQVDADEVIESHHLISSF